MLCDFQYRFNLPFDTGFYGDLVSSVQQVGDQVDVSSDETRQHVLRVDIREVNGGMKMWELLFQLLQQVAGLGFMLMG